MFWNFFKSHPFEVIKTAGSEKCDKLIMGVLSYFKWKGKKLKECTMQFHLIKI